MIPTLSARLRRQQLQDLARMHEHPPCQLKPEPPLALQSYLHRIDDIHVDSDAPAPGCESACEDISAEQQCTSVRPALPAGIELLLWLALLLIDSGIALRDLLAENRRRSQGRPQGSRRNTSGANRGSVVTWLGGAVHPSGLA